MQSYLKKQYNGELRFFDNLRKSYARLNCQLKPEHVNDLKSSISTLTNILNNLLECEKDDAVLFHNSVNLRDQIKIFMKNYA